MRRWLGRGALVALAFILCWGGAVWYWRATNRMPATGDLVLYLLILPVGLLLAVWLGRRLIALAAAAPVAVAATPVPAAEVAPPAPAPLALLDAALRLPHADSTEQLVAGLQDASARPTLDSVFVDNNGYPVMTARSDSAVDPALQAACRDWLQAQGLGDIAFLPAQWRALTLATGAVADVAAPAAGAWASVDAGAPMLHLVALLPEAWATPQRQAAVRWLAHTVAECGWAHDRVQATAGVALPGSVALALAQPATGLTLIVACASHLAQETVDAWSDAGTLFAATTPQGAIPGEGAAAVLVTGQLHAVQHDARDYTLLHPLAHDVRPQSADASKRADATLLSTLAGQALTRSGTPAASIKLVVTDTGQRVTRVLEVAGAIDAAVPHLDAGDDVLAVGTASGACGVVPFIAALAVAHQQARDRAAPVLCLGNDDPLFRCVAVIGPAAPAS